MANDTEERTLDAAPEMFSQNGYGAFILLAKALCHLVEYGISVRTAARINARIRENRLEKRKEMIP